MTEQQKSSIQTYKKTRINCQAILLYVDQRDVDLLPVSNNLLCVSKTIN